MKSTEINAIFSAKVNELLAAGYQINTNTMDGSQGEIAKIDFRKNEEVIPFGKVQDLARLQGLKLSLTRTEKVYQ